MTIYFKTATHEYSRDGINYHTCNSVLLDRDASTVTLSPSDGRQPIKITPAADTVVIDTTSNAAGTFTPATLVVALQTVFPKASTAGAGGAGLNTDGTYTADGTTNYISGATSLKNADKLLDTQVKVNTDAIGNIHIPANYVITKSGSTITATPAIGSGLTAYSGTDAYTVIQAAITALTPVGGGAGSGGGYIHLSNDDFALSNELLVNGWEGLGGNVAPYSQLIIKGSGFKTKLIQTTANKNAIVIKNNTSVVIRDLQIICSSAARSCILGDSNGATSEISFYRGMIDNVLCTASSSAYPAVYLKNIFDLTIPTLYSYNLNYHGIILENDSTTVHYGNSTWGHIYTFGSMSASFAGMVVRTTNNNWVIMQMDIGYYFAIAYRGIYSSAMYKCTFRKVDIEGCTEPVYFTGAGDFSNGETKHNTILDGYLLVNGTKTVITQTAGTGGNYIKCLIQCDTTSIPISDASQFRHPNEYDVSVIDSTCLANVSITNAAKTRRKFMAANNELVYNFLPPTTVRVLPRIQTVTSAATVTPSADNDDMVKVTAQAAALTLANPSGTPVGGQSMVVRVKDNGTARAITFGTQYRAIGVTLPTTTIISKTLYIGMIYNADDTKWDVTGISQEA